MPLSTDDSQFDELMKEGYQETASLNIEVAEDYFGITTEAWPDWGE